MAAVVAQQSIFTKSLLLAQRQQAGVVFNIIWGSNGGLMATANGEKVTLKGQLPKHLAPQHLQSAIDFLQTNSSFLWDRLTSTLTVHPKLSGGGACLVAFDEDFNSLATTDSAVQACVRLKAAVSAGNEDKIQRASAALSNMKTSEIPDSPFSVIRSLIEAVGVTQHLSYETQGVLAKALHDYVDLAFIFSDGIEQETLITLARMLDGPISNLRDNDFDLRFSLESAQEGLKAFYQLTPELRRFLKFAYRINQGNGRGGAKLPIAQVLYRDLTNLQTYSRSWYVRVLVGRVVEHKIATPEAFDQFKLFLGVGRDWHVLYTLMSALGWGVSGSILGSIWGGLEEVSYSSLLPYLEIDDETKTKDVSNVKDSWIVRIGAIRALTRVFPVITNHPTLIFLYKPRVVAIKEAFEKQAKVEKHPIVQEKLKEALAYAIKTIAEADAAGASSD